MDKVWMKPFDGGEPKEVEATPEILTPLLVQGWHQVPAPEGHKPVASIGIIKDSE